MIINIKNEITLSDFPRNLGTELMARLSFENPAFIEAKKMNRWVGRIPRYLKFFELIDGTLTIPRGFIRELLALCRERKISYSIEDDRRVLPAVDFTFQGQLKPFQEKAVEDILKHDFGTVCSPTGSGKTVMALAAIAERKQPVLIVTHVREIQVQWIDRIETFLGIPAEEIGVIGNGKKVIGDRVTVALVQTLHKCAQEVSPHIGFIIVDEAHHSPATQMSAAVKAFDSKFMLSISATLKRRDQLERLIFWYCGQLIHKISKQDLVKTGHIVRIEAKLRETGFQTKLNPSKQYTSMISELCRDSGRTQLIVNDIVKESRTNEGTLLVLSDRKSHLDDIREALRSRGMRPHLLTGSVPGKERDDIVKKLEAGEVKVLLSTIPLLAEGFDSSRLGTLFLCTPVKFAGRITQIIGRLLRPAEGKRKAKIFDYVDSLVGPLRASAEARQRVYRGG